MPKISNKMKGASSPLLVAAILLLVFGTVAVAQDHQNCYNPWSFGKNVWSFGIMGDTQWTPGIPGLPDDPEGTNPNFVSLSIAKQINQEFIKHGVKFVIQMGDMTNWGGEAAIASWADEANTLYNAGIGFFPMRGNHETYGSFFAPWGLPDLDPNKTYTIPEIQTYFPQTRGLSNTFGATNFSSPTQVSPDLNGISYSFDYGDPCYNARFVIVDPWATKSSLIIPPGLYVYYGYPIGTQQAWIDERLDGSTRGTTHAFVLSHQNILGQNHEDTPFGGFPGENLEEQNAFYASLEDNGVRYYISGHDHMHNRSVLTSPDGSSKVTQIITQPASSKFYAPTSLEDEGWQGQKDRELSLSQELYNVGYYIYTIDGPRVTVDYYADEDDNFLSDGKYPNNPDGEDNAVFQDKVTPKFNFVKKETWGYSINGKEFLVMQDASYTSVVDAYNGTTAKILSGLNNSSNTDANGRDLVKAVNTGWRPGTALGLLSEILTLWGMADLGTTQTDTYTLSLTYDPSSTAPSKAIVTQNPLGFWVNAVDMNFGGTKKFVKGPWKTGYPLGTYGIDTATNTAWAVVNYNADFAVTSNVR
jgi:hypothetical protein